MEMRVKEATIESLRERLRGRPPNEILAHALETFHPAVVNDETGPVI